MQTPTPQTHWSRAAAEKARTLKLLSDAIRSAQSAGDTETAQAIAERMAALEAAGVR